MTTSTLPMLETYPQAINLDRIQLAATIDILDDCAEACTACDNSCLMHIQGALHRQRAGVKTVHLAEILAGSEEAAL